MKLYTTLLIFVVSTLWSGNAYSQQFPLFFSNRDNGFLINPSMTVVPVPIEFKGRPSPQKQIKTIAMITGRLQWQAFEKNSPKTGTFNIQQKIGYSPLWAGAFAITDQTGPLSFTGIGIKGSVTKNLKNNQAISGGISLTYFQHTLDLGSDLLQFYDENDPTITENAEFNTFLAPGFGIFYSSNKFYAGLSIPYLVFLDPAEIRSFSDQYYITAGGFVPLANSQILLEPSLWVQHSNGTSDFTATSTLLDANVKLWYFIESDFPFWAGLGFNNNSHWRAEAGVITGATYSKKSKNTYFKLGIAYGNQVGVAAGLGNIFEASIGILVN